MERDDPPATGHARPGRVASDLRHPAAPTHRRFAFAPVQLDILATVAAGGMIGAAARYGVSRAVAVPAGGFPWATFWVNISGSFALGVVLVLLLERFPPTRYLRPLLATGVLGAYTTMSTYQVEVVLLLKDGHVATGAGYAVASLAAGLAAAYGGILAGRLAPLRHRRKETP